MASNAFSYSEDQETTLLHFFINGRHGKHFLHDGGFREVTLSNDELHRVTEISPKVVAISICRVTQKHSDFCYNIVSEYAVDVTKLVENPILPFRYNFRGGEYIINIHLKPYFTLRYADSETHEPLREDDFVIINKKCGIPLIWKEGQVQSTFTVVEASLSNTFDEPHDNKSNPVTFEAYADLCTLKPKSNWQGASVFLFLKPK